MKAALKGQTDRPFMANKAMNNVGKMYSIVGKVAKIKRESANEN